MILVRLLKKDLPQKLKWVNWNIFLLLWVNGPEHWLQRSHLFSSSLGELQLQQISSQRYQLSPQIVDINIWYEKNKFRSSIAIFSVEPVSCLFYFKYKLLKNCFVHLVEAKNAVFSGNRRIVEAHLSYMNHLRNWSLGTYLFCFQ